MKKIMGIIITIIIVLCILAIPILVNLNATFYLSATTENNFHVGYHKLLRKAFVGCYSWDGSEEHKIINIPEEYNGYKVKTLGGVIGRGAPSPFCVNLPDKYCNESIALYDPIDTLDWYPKGYEVVEIMFDLNISKNITKLYDVEKEYYQYKNKDGSYTLYHPVYYINCSKDNKTFYSKDGKLYYKKNDELVEDFSYPQESY